MYGKLTQLQEGVASQVGAGAGKLWNEAKELDKTRFRLQENSEFLFGRDLNGAVTPQIEQGLNQLAKGNTKKFNEVIESVPADMKNRVIVSGLDSLINKTQQGESSISTAQFNSWYGELSNSQYNKKLLHDNLPEGAGQRLDDLFKLSQGLQNVTSKITRTGIVSDAFKNFDKTGGLIDRLYSTADNISKVPVVGSMVGAPSVRIASGILKMASKEKTPAVEAADDLLSSPSFKTAVLDFEKNGKQSPDIKKKLESDEKYKKYMKAQDDAKKILIQKNGLVPFLISGEEPTDD